MTVTEILRSVRFVVDPQGRPMAAMLDIEAWQELMAWIKDVEDVMVPPTSQPENVKPVESLEELWGDFWPEDETVDDFIDAVRRWRRDDLTLHEELS